MKKKSIAMLAAVVMLAAVLIVGGTLAYFTATKTATNTFTLGNVDITLDEAKVGDDGLAVPGADRVTENTYTLTPGITVDKDPTVTNTGANDCYVRMTVTITDAAAFQAAAANHGITDLTTIFGGYSDANWTRVGNPATDTDADTMTYVYTYNTPLAKGTNTGALFTTVTLPGVFTNAELAELEDNFTITVTADAIQADAFDSVADAFAAYDTQAATVA